MKPATLGSGREGFALTGFYPFTMANPYGRAVLAGNLGEALQGRVPVAQFSSPGRNSRGGAAGMRAQVGLVSPPGRIVLWDEWASVQPCRHLKESPGPAEPTPAPSQGSRTTKEVMGDEKTKV